MGVKWYLLVFFFLFDHATCIVWGFPGGGSDDKESACNVGDLGSTPELGRSPGEENGCPLQYSCLGNPIDKGVWQAPLSWGSKRVVLDLVTQQQCEI